MAGFGWTLSRHLQRTGSLFPLWLLLSLESHEILCPLKNRVLQSWLWCSYWERAIFRWWWANYSLPAMQTTNPGVLTLESSAVWSCGKPYVSMVRNRLLETLWQNTVTGALVIKPNRHLKYCFQFNKRSDGHRVVISLTAFHEERPL